MSMEQFVLIVALVLALVHEFQAQGKSLLGWAVVLIAAVLVLPIFR